MRSGCLGLQSEERQQCGRHLSVNRIRTGLTTWSTCTSCTSGMKPSPVCLVLTQACTSSTAKRSARKPLTSRSSTSMKPVTRSVSMSTERPRRMISSPSQQVSAVVATRDFLLRLINTKETPRIPREVRREARALLRHYPIAEHLRPVLEQGLNSEKL